MASPPPVTTENPWHTLLHTRMREQPVPMLVMPDTLWSAASSWVGVRAWTRAFRSAGLVAGDRVVCALPEGPAFIQVLLACLWDELVFAPISPKRDAMATVQLLDARALITADNTLCTQMDGVFVPDIAAQPPAPLPALRAAHAPPTAGVALLLATSGTAGPSRWVGLSNRNLMAVLDSHRPRLGLQHACVLSVLPWSHAFGLVLGLLPALLDADEIVRDPLGGRNTAQTVALAELHPITHVDLVPLLAERWLAHDAGRALLHRVRGGIVGGAAISATMADALVGTQLRVGYGQTEASPGITLGEPGVFSEGALGAALGCEVRRDDDGVLAFRGRNACDGIWVDGAYTRLDPDRWQRTGDLVERSGADEWRYIGRLSASFKLANGRMIPAAQLEDSLRAAIPDIADVVLFTRDGLTLDVVLSTQTGDAASPDDVRAALGTLAASVARIRQISASSWPRTPKGDIDRRALPSLG